MQDAIDDLLRNYRQLVARVDTMCEDVARAYPEAVTCYRGCDSCCRHLTLFPVEGAAILAAVAALPAADAADLQERARQSRAEGPCPLLAEGSCLLYAARPLICRTHGYPLLLVDGAERRVDFCPRNFQGIRSLPPTAVLDLDRLNAALAVINALFIRESGWKASDRERLFLIDFLLTPMRGRFSVEK